MISERVYRKIQKQKADWQEFGVIFLTRQRLMLNMLHSVKNKKILDFGCGVGNILKFLSERGAECHGIDPSPSAIKFALKKTRRLKNVKVLRWDHKKKHSLQNEYYDAVVCIEVLEHIKEDRDAIKLFSNVLKKDGTVVVTVPTTKESLRVPTHYRIYDKKSLTNLFTEEGFKIERIMSYGFPLLRASELIYRTVNGLLNKPKEKEIRGYPTGGGG